MAKTVAACNQRDAITWAEITGLYLQEAYVDLKSAQLLTQFKNGIWLTTHHKVGAFFI